jgi:hypothetical protein
VGLAGPEGGAISVFGAGRGKRGFPGFEPDDGFSISGPNLVSGGFAALSHPATFADPRHLILFPYVKVIDRPSIDLGMDLLLDDETLYARAARGEPVELPLLAPFPTTDAVDATIERVPIELDSVRAALRVKGYIEVRGGLQARGEFRFAPNAVQIRFLPGIYPHHALVTDKAGRIASVLVSGKSNRVGVSLEDFSEDLARCGAKEAILLDNGGDVALYDVRAACFRIASSETDRLDLWPISACLAYNSGSTGTL